jgi:hypothetical protein
MVTTHHPRRYSYPLPASLLACKALTIATVLVSAARAQAQPADDPREIEARAACAAGDAEKGVALLARLFAETGDYTWVYNQGRCYQQNGRAEEALNRFREYLRRAKDLSAEDRSEVEGFISELEGELSRRSSGPPGSTKPGDPEKPAPEASVRTSSAPDRGAGWPWQTKAGVGAVAGAGVALVVGVVFHVSREGKADDFVSAGCGTSDLSVANCRSLYDGVKTAERLMLVGYVGAAVLGGTGAVMLWLGSRESQDGAVARARPYLACAPQLGAPGLTCGGRF